MKKLLNTILMAAVLLGLGWSVTSCKDDDDEKNEQRADADVLDTEEARIAFRWLCVLTDATTLPDDWKSKTFEPTLGHPSDNNPYTRLVVVRDMDEAMVNFSKMADIDVKDLNMTWTVNGGAAGTMVWTPLKSDAQVLAEVVVSSRIIPHLQKIIYCTQDQLGSNGYLWDSMKGTAYYRFGDVVKDNDGYYWVCVRPSFAPDKYDSHWINIFNAAESGGGKGMPKENIKDTWNKLDKYNKQVILLPTKLAYDREHIYYLNNLIWALLKPEDYKDACLANKSLGLGGFPYDNHGEEFLKLVSQYWETKVDGYTIWQKLFNHTSAEMNQLTQFSFIYYGYSWTIGNTGYIYRYKSKKYEPKYTGKNSTDEEKYDFVKGGFDITYFANEKESSPLPFKSFNTDDAEKTGTWVIRYKKGKDLCTSGSYSAYRDVGLTDVYRYNKNRNISAGENVKPETEDDIKNVAKTSDLPLHSAKDPKLHYLLAKNGYYYANVSDCTADHTEPVAIIVGVDDELEEGIVLEKNSNYKYLLMAVKPAEGNIINPFGPDEHCCTMTEYGKFTGICDGLAVTEKLKSGCNNKHAHEAARSVWNTTLGITEERRQELGLSHGFLPSAGQIVIMLNGFWGPTGAFNDGPEGWVNDDAAIAFDNYCAMLSNTEDGENGLTEDDLSIRMIISSTEIDNKTILLLSFAEGLEMTGNVKFFPKAKSAKDNRALPFFLAK